MTREEAKDKIGFHVGQGLSRALMTIDDIYDDFENKTCENCKYLDLNNQCWKSEELHQAQCTYGYKDFCCNRFEEKV
jgi:hypothetical protein